MRLTRNLISAKAPASHIGASGTTVLAIVLALIVPVLGAAQSSGSVDDVMKALRERAKNVPPTELPSSSTRTLTAPPREQPRPAARTAAKTPTAQKTGQAKKEGTRSGQVDGGAGLGTFTPPEELLPALPTSFPILTYDESLRKAVADWKDGADEEQEHFDAAVAVSLSGDWAGSIRAWEKFKQQQKHSWSTGLYNLGVSHAYVGNWRKAEQELQKAYDFGWRDEGLLEFALAVAHLHNGDLRKARQLLQELIRRYPERDAPKAALLFVEAARRGEK
jgi:TolA-binding protein